MVIVLEASVASMILKRVDLFGSASVIGGSVIVPSLSLRKEPIPISRPRLLTSANVMVDRGLTLLIEMEVGTSAIT